jgi:hypothetical protein
VGLWGYETMFYASLVFSIVAVILLGVNVKDPRGLSVVKPPIR